MEGRPPCRPKGKTELAPPPVGNNNGLLFCQHVAQGLGQSTIGVKRSQFALHDGLNLFGHDCAKAFHVWTIAGPEFFKRGYRGANESAAYDQIEAVDFKIYVKAHTVVTRPSLKLKSDGRNFPLFGPGAGLAFFAETFYLKVFRCLNGYFFQ